MGTCRIQVEELLCQPQWSVLHTTHNTTNIHHREKRRILQDLEMSAAAVAAAAAVPSTRHFRL